MSSSMTGARGMSPSGRTGNVIPKGHQLGQIQQYGGGQLQRFEDLLGLTGPESYLGRLAGGDEATFNQIEAPQLQQFQQLMGQQAGRFGGQGGGALRSSGYQNLASQQTQDFAGQLASRRQELQRGALKDLFDMSHSLLQERPYEQFLIEKQQKKTPFWKQLLLQANQNGQELAGTAAKAAMMF